jgi:hypothetical protein
MHVGVLDMLTDVPLSGVLSRAYSQIKPIFAPPAVPSMAATAAS